MKTQHETMHISGYRGFAVYEVNRFGWDFKYSMIRVFGNFYEALNFLNTVRACGLGEYRLVEYK